MDFNERREKIEGKRKNSITIESQRTGQHVPPHDML
jgi:hypothetical protein